MDKQTFRPIPLQGRILVFDFLKSLMIFFVIVLHVSMTYMQSPSWWYIISDKASPVFLVIVNILDVFMIPVLFFISGYFAPASYARKGFSGFLKDKIKHIFFPWILGIIILIPIFSLLLGKSIGHFFQLLKDNPFYLFNSQGHLWYLGILFIFLLVYALFSYFVPFNKIRTTSTGRKNTYLLLGGIVISLICAYLSTLFWGPFDNWLYFAYVFCLKPAKIATYICVFGLGVYAWQTNWFTKNGWMPSINTWRILAISTMTCYMILRLLIIPKYDFPSLDKLISVFDAVCSFTTLIYTLLIGIKFQTIRIAEWMVNASPYSYSIYWIHMLPMILYLSMINEWDISIFLKWISGIFVVCLFSWLFSKYILKKLPLLKDMF